MAGHKLIKDKIWFRVGKWDNILVFKDPWLPTNSPYIVTAPSNDLMKIKVYSLLDEAGQWDVDLLKDLFMERDINSILSIPRPIYPGEDSLYWEGDNKGTYSVKRGYWYLNEGSLRPNVAPTFPRNQLWKIDAPFKVRNLLWRVIKNVIPTKINISLKKVENDGLCVFCENGVDSIDHVFLRCRWIERMWHSMALQITGNEVNIMEWIVGILQGPNVEDHLSLTAGIWALWHHTNEIT